MPETCPICHVAIPPGTIHACAATSYAAPVLAGIHKELVRIRELLEAQQQQTPAAPKAARRETRG